VNSDYSIRVQSNKGSLVYSAPAATERYSDVVVNGVNAEDVIYDPPFSGAVPTNVEEKLSEIISVTDFGAVGDGVADDTVAIQAALTAANGKDVFVPEGTYLISSELSATNCSLIGANFNYTILKATAAMRSIVKGFNCYEISGIKFLCENLANHGVFNQENTARVDQCWIQDALYDGYTNDPTTGNTNLAVVSKTVFRGNGTVYSTGTADTVAGGTTITISGAVNLTTLGIRTGIDFIYIPALSMIFTITSVGATTLGVSASPDAPKQTLSGTTYSIRSGAGVFNNRSGDGNGWVVEKCTFQTNAGAAVRDTSLYGLRATDNICEANTFMWRHNGDRVAPGVTFDGVDVGNYMESIIWKTYYMEYSDGFRSFAPTAIDLDSIELHPNTGGEARFYLRSGDYTKYITSYSNSTAIVVNSNENISVFSGVNGTIELVPQLGTTAAKYLQQIEINLYTNANVKYQFISDYPVNGVSGVTGVFVSNAARSRPKHLTATWVNESDGWIIDNVSLEVSEIIDVPSIANAASYSQNITILGARISDYVKATSNDSLGGLILTASVSSADTVTLTWANLTGASVNLANATYYISVSKT
jgi:hypothetical protein